MSYYDDDGAIKNTETFKQTWFCQKIDINY